MKDYRILIVLVATLALLIFLNCHKKQGNLMTEGYSRTPMGGNCLRVRTPVDYYSAPERNPHWRAFTGDYFMPLELSKGTDFDQSIRRIQDGTIYADFRNDFNRYGPESTPNDEKTRLDLIIEGELDQERALQNAPFHPENNVKDPLLRRPSY